MKKQRHILGTFIFSFLIMLMSVALTAVSPITAAAAEVAGGNCGSGLSWSLSDDGILTITGTGEMTSRPWSAHKASIKSVILPNGLTTLCNHAFEGFTQLEGITSRARLQILAEMPFRAVQH